MKTTEKSLIQASQRGDTAAFDRLIRKYEGRIYRLSHSVCAGIPAEAEDVYQETFLTAFKKIRGFKGRSSLGTWLYRIASNICWQKFRRIKRTPVVPILDRPISDDDDALSRLFGEERLQVVAQIERVRA